MDSSVFRKTENVHKLLRLRHLAGTSGAMQEMILEISDGFPV